MSSQGADTPDHEEVVAYIRHAHARMMHPSGDDHNASDSQARREARLITGRLQDVPYIASGTGFSLAVAYYAGHAFANRVATQRDFVKQCVDISVSFAGLVFSCIWYGITQEAIMTTEYNGGRFPSVVFLTFSNQAFMVACSGIALWLRREPIRTEACRWCWVPAVTACAAAWSQESALLFIAFPVQAVFKSSRIAPQMIVDTLMNSCRHGWIDYLFAVAVSACVFGFTLAMHGDHAAIMAEFAWVGVFLMCLFLFCDALTGGMQKLIYNRFPHISNFEMMFVSGSYQLMYLMVAVMFSRGFATIFHFLWLNSAALRDLAELGISATISQYLALYIIKAHGPVILAFMLAIRQVLSVLVSCLMFRHPLSTAAVVFAAGALGVGMARPFIQSKMNPSPVRAAQKLADEDPLEVTPKQAVQYGAVQKGTV